LKRLHPVRSARFITPLVMVLMTITGIAHAATTSTSTTLAAFSDTTNGIFNTRATTGLDQFDPALGTLTGVHFDITSSYTAAVFLEAYVIDEADANELEAQASFQVSLTVPTGGGGGLLFANGGDSAYFGCSEGAFGGACSDSLNPEIVSDTYAETDDATTRLVNNGLLSLFVGTGNLDFMKFGLFFFANGAIEVFNAVNIDVVGGEIEFDLGPTDITVTYTYNPVPLPPAALLFAPLAAGIVLRGRKKS